MAGEWQRIEVLIQKEPDPAKRRALFCGWLESMVPGGFVVVGGSALEAYSSGDYATMDVDVIAIREQQLQEALKVAGFVREGRHWIREDLRLYIEMPTGPLAGEETRARHVTVQGVGIYRVIGLEDLVIDRLNACVYWKSQSDCQWAAYLLARFTAEMDQSYLRERAAKDGVLPALHAMVQNPEGGRGE